MRNREKTFWVFMAICLVVFFFCFPGCGAVHGTDGRTITLLGVGRITDGQTQTEVGVGKGMDTNLSSPRANTFDDRSSAAADLYGGGE